MEISLSCNKQMVFKDGSSSMKSCRDPDIYLVAPWKLESILICIQNHSSSKQQNEGIGVDKSLSPIFKNQQGISMYLFYYHIDWNLVTWPYIKLEARKCNIYFPTGMDPAKCWDSYYCEKNKKIKSNGKQPIVFPTLSYKAEELRDFQCCSPITIVSIIYCYVTNCAKVWWLKMIYYLS